jgi:LPXTG-motif cell wall-anchored protein
VKHVITLFLITVLSVVVLQRNAYATFNPAPSPVCGDGQHTGNPHCTASPTVWATHTPGVSPTATPFQTAKPSDTPTASASATPIATSTPEATPSPTEHVDRTDLTDNRSDGHTESLGCLRPEDNCNEVANFSGIGGGQELPSTGNNSAYTTLLIGAGLLISGLFLRAISRTI